MTLTVGQLAACLSIDIDHAAQWIDSINSSMYGFGIDTAQRQSAFIAQIGEETGGLTVLIENLMYGASGLLRTWPLHFDETNAPVYAYHPESIANRAYANRMGNGDENSGDGWAFRGRGCIQITGRSEYVACGLGLKLDLLADPDLLATPPYAALSAAWYWQSNGCNELADAGTFPAITERINGGLINEARREQYLEACCEALSIPNWLQGQK